MISKIALLLLSPPPYRVLRKTGTLLIFDTPSGYFVHNQLWITSRNSCSSVNQSWYFNCPFFDESLRTRQGQVSSMKCGSIAGVLLALLLSALAQQPAPSQPSQIVAQSRQALTDHNPKQALRLVLDGLVAFPDNEELELQLARVFAYERQDAQAIAKINNILGRNPSNRDAKLALAQVYGYRDD